MSSITKRRGFRHFALAKKIAALFFDLESDRLKIRNPV